MKTQTVLAIGAHIGDAELTAGALLASCAVHGGKAVTLSLTAGEKGAPAGAEIAEYRLGKIAEAEAFAKELGGEAYVLDYEDSLLPDNDEVRFAVCDIIRKVKPDIIVTHHENSMHKDHMSATESWWTPGSMPPLRAFSGSCRSILPKSFTLRKTGRMHPALSHTSMWT